MSALSLTKPCFSPLIAQNSDPYFELHKQGQFSPWSRKIFDDCLTKPYFAYSLDLDNQPLGYYIGMRVLDEVTLMDIVVGAAHRGKGVGKSLLQHLMDHCNQHNIQQIWLEVRESNAAAIKLYDNAGFIVVEQRVNYYPSEKGKEDALIMCCYLG
ncbi:ribosomal protein S18-alanine N-acetyltransferase [uncultured Paraglaciecola sp.]|uniref:ribosomal protein S18-alanine N-acetyltransferase n=1 Tax=uncultured Paraglaciecola sp. TaxID=1765024 RepID=UPI0030D7EAA6